MNKYTLTGKLAERGVTQSEVAFWAGVSEAAVSRWFNGGYVSDKLSGRIEPVVRGVAQLKAADVRADKKAALESVTKGGGNG
jgi:predicted transcriptional regulator